MKIFKYPHQKKKNILLIAAAVSLLILLILYLYATTPVDNRQKTLIVEIPKGTSFVDIVDILDQSGLIKYKPLFYLLALTKGDTRHIRAGEYEIASTSTPSAIIDKLVKGEIKLYKITIPEDFNLRDIAARLASPPYKLVNEKAFLKLASDQEFLASIGIEEFTAEGYLFPDTYKLDRSMTEREIITIMVKQFRKKVTPDMLRKAKELGLNQTEFITLASIIGKESGNKEEKPLISAVFHNRLKKGMKLQSDPTAIYDLQNYEGNVKRSHLRRKSPHNTYMIDGLPPGPIANPGIDSLMATIYPAPAKYLFFVSKNDGTHLFSSTFTAHNQAILKYQISSEK